MLSVQSGSCNDCRSNELRSDRSRRKEAGPALSRAECSQPIGRRSISPDTAGLDLRVERVTVWHHDVTGLAITHHQAVVVPGQVQCDQETQAGVQSVLIGLLRRSLLSNT